MALPRITQSDLLRRWQSANELSWEDHSFDCVDCRVEFKTGDVNFTYPEPEVAPDAPAIVSRIAGHRCVSCAWRALTEKGVRFNGIGVFVERAHQHRTFEELPKATQAKMLESFELVDRLSTELERAAKAPEERPS